MNTPELLFFIAFGAVAVFLITTMVRGWFKKRRVAAWLGRRERRDDEQFARFFSNPKTADIAVRVRRVLSNNLKMPLDGLTPGDRLDELDAELPANPHLFWELETEFGIKTKVEDLEAHRKTLEQLGTIHDLVAFVENKISEPRPQTPEDEEDEGSSRVYDFAIRSVPVLCVGGFVTLVIGAATQKRVLMNLGGAFFLAGVAVWGVANGGEMLWQIFRSARGASRKEIAARSLRLILLTCLALFFLWVGGMVAWGILKNILSSR